MKFVPILLVIHLCQYNISSFRFNLTQKDLYHNWIFSEKKTVKSHSSSSSQKPNFISSSLTRIIGGKPADIKKFPFAACIILKQFEIDYFRGGAVIIKRHWAITAAHCMQYISDDLIQKGRVFMRSNSVSWQKNFMEHLVIESYVHENYNTDKTNYDIALLKILEPFNGKYEKPVKLARIDYKYKDNSIATVVGWGVTDPNSQDPSAVERLRYAEVNIINFEACKESYRKSNETITNYMICAAALNKDACFYDSGGPLYQNQVLIGIVSWGGATCAVMKYPGVYTKVSKFYNWVNNKIQIQNGDKIISQNFSF